MSIFVRAITGLLAALFLTAACSGSTDTTDDLKTSVDVPVGSDDAVMVPDLTVEDVQTLEDNAVAQDVVAPEETTMPEDVPAADTTVAADCSPTGNIANLKACAEGPVDVTVKGATVTYVFDQGYFIADGSGATEVYTTDTWPYDKVTAGQVIDIHVTEYGSFHGQQEVVASDAPVVTGTNDVAQFGTDISSGILPAEELESAVVFGTGFKVQAVDDKNLMVGYGTATAITFRANDASDGMCVGATFDVLQAIVTQYDDEHRIQAFFAADLTNINTDKCQAPVEADDSNWGFEEGGPNNPPADFTTDGDGITAEWTTEMAHTGSNGCKLTWTSTDNQDFIQGYFKPVAAGQLATLKLWAIENDAAGRFRLCLEFYSDTFMSLKKEYSNTYTEDGADWTQLEFGFQAPEGAAYVRGFVRMYDVVEGWDGDAAAYIDDWELTVQ